MHRTWALTLKPVFKKCGALTNHVSHKNRFSNLQITQLLKCLTPQCLVHFKVLRTCIHYKQKPVSSSFGLEIIHFQPTASRSAQNQISAKSKRMSSTVTTRVSYPNCACRAETSAASPLCTLSFGTHTRGCQLWDSERAHTTQHFGKFEGHAYK